MNPTEIGINILWNALIVDALSLTLTPKLTYLLTLNLGITLGIAIGLKLDPNTLSKFKHELQFKWYMRKYGPHNHNH